ncbi:MAG: PAS domain-containing sensor histidine kinase [Candidatus Obscuribacterales bacterium]|nr:PAS domain-containing sensor histidine kinase [Candidatus Obscuribacterales bacterium]
MSSEEIAQLQEEVKKLRKELSNAKSQLTHNQMQIRAVINATPVGLFITGAKGKIEASNPYSLGLFRCGYQDLIDRDIRELLKSTEITEIFESELNFEDCHREALTATKFDGETFAAEIALKPFLGVRGIKYVVIVEDVSARQRAQDSRDEILGMLSHEFRSPLTGINMSADVLEEIFQQTAAMRLEEVNPVLMQPLQNVKQSSSRMLEVVNKLLDLEELQSNFNLHFETVWLNLAVDRALQEVEPFAHSKKIVLEKKQMVCRIIADQNRLVQLLVNLLSNAIRFSPGRSTVEIATQNFGNDILIAVTDSGPGVPEDRKTDIFKKWKQNPEKSAPLVKSLGPGLGLPICKAIVEGHGGTIGVRSRESGGSIFWVKLPVRLEQE